MSKPIRPDTEGYEAYISGMDEAPPIANTPSLRNEDTMNEDLFDLIGGPSTVEAATKLFYEKILQDESLRHFFEGVDMAHIRSHGRLC